MKKILLVLMISINSVFCQNNGLGKDYSINQINGIWQNQEFINQFIIIKNGLFIRLYNTNDSINFRMFKIKKCGFISANDTTLNEMKQTGNSFDDRLLLGNDYTFNFSKNENTSLINFMELTNSNIFYFKRVDKLPLSLIKVLNLISKNQHKDYVKQFLSRVFKEIIISKSFINNKDFQPTQMYLLKNDEVEILEEKDEWYKIRYYGKKTIEGWIKKSDVSN